MEINESLKLRWQKIADLMADITGVPAGLIMRLKDGELEVFTSSQTDGNPFKVGKHATLEGSGFYCEAAIKSNRMLKVPDSLSDEHWKNNPDVKSNMISYLGFPIRYPDQTPFGTICVLDNKENHYSETYQNLIEGFRDFIEIDLELLILKDKLKEL